MAEPKNANVQIKKRVVAIDGIEEPVEYFLYVDNEIKAILDVREIFALKRELDRVFTNLEK